MTSPQTQDIVLTHVFHAPVSAVWKAWTDPELIRRWWGPDHFDCPSAMVDFREGGVALVSMRSIEFGFPEQFSTWRFTKIVPMERIEYTHHLADREGNDVKPSSIGMPADFPEDVHHVITFEDLGDGTTKLTVTEKEWPMGQMRELSKMGMEQCLEKMAKVLAS